MTAHPAAPHSQVASPDQNTPPVEEHLTSRGQLHAVAKRSAPAKGRWALAPPCPAASRAGPAPLNGTTAGGGRGRVGRETLSVPLFPQDLCMEPDPPSPRAALNVPGSHLSSRHTDGRKSAPSWPQGGGLETGLPGFLVPSGFKVMPTGSLALEHSPALRCSRVFLPFPFFPGTHCNWAQLAVPPGQP